MLELRAHRHLKCLLGQKDRESRLEYIDFRKDFDQGCRDLLAVWKLKHKRA